MHRKVERDRWFSSQLYNVYWMRGAKPNRQSICTLFDSDLNEITEHKLDHGNVVPSFQGASASLARIPDMTFTHLFVVGFMQYDTNRSS